MIKSYIYKPKCKDCLNTNGNFRFTCKTCGTDYSACVKEIKGENEKLIYFPYPGRPFLSTLFFQDYWIKEFENIILMK